MQQIAPVTRNSLDADPAVAHRQVSEWIEATRSSLDGLVRLRDQIAREIAGPGRGGAARLAEVAGVSNVQAGRLLRDGLVRAVRDALTEAGYGRGDYRIIDASSALPARVGLELVVDDEGPTVDVDPDVDGEEVYRHARQDARSASWVRRMNTAGAMLDALRRAGMVAAGDGLGMDVGGHGPRAALAEGRPVEIYWG